MDFDDFHCPRCKSEHWRVTRKGGNGRGPRFWHVYCANAECGTIIMDVRNDSGSVIPLLSKREPE